MHVQNVAGFLKECVNLVALLCCDVDCLSHEHNAKHAFYAQFHELLQYRIEYRNLAEGFQSGAISRMLECS